MAAFRLLHGRFKVLGFRIGNVAYCTDTNQIPPESLALLDGLDVLVLDALRPQPHVSHFSLDQAIAVSQQLRPKLTLLTHLSHELEHAATVARLPPGIAPAYDGLRVPLT
jgi:phosphoribosyl 1,2-cyclic phosphate phosphodiesterase